MNKRQKAGNTGRSSGLGYEDKFIAKHGGDKPQDQKNLWGEKKTRAKTDVISKNVNYSVKNPKNVAISVQIQVCSLQNFARLTDMDDATRLAFSMWLGSDSLLSSKKSYRDVEQFKKFHEKCNLLVAEELIPFEYMCGCCELKRCRFMFNRIPNAHLMTSFLENNLEKVARFIMSTGFNDLKNEETVAQKMAWSTIKDDIDSIRIFDIEKILATCDTWEVNVQSSQTVIKFGPFTLQMKGSGSGSAYHYMQFNASYNSIKTLLNNEGERL